MSSLIDIRIDGAANLLRLNRPDKRNALTSPMYVALTEALAAGDADADVAAHVLAGHPGAFCAGNDIAEFKAYADSGALGPAVLGFLRALVTTRKPLIAAVDGLAIGVGTTLLLHCDMVYATARSVFRTPFMDLGLLPEAGSSLLMPRRMGHVRAFEMICLGETFTAERALAAGLVNALVPAGELEASALATVKRLAAKPPEALAAARRLMRAASEAEVLARMDEEAQMFTERLRSAEAREAFAAFLEKRPPDFAKLRRSDGGR